MHHAMREDSKPHIHMIVHEPKVQRLSKLPQRKKRLQCSQHKCCFMHSGQGEAPFAKYIART